MNRMQEAETYRITDSVSERIDILKVWLTVMVVFIHSYKEEVHLLTGTIDFWTPYWLDILKYTISQCISRCAVPAFFMISAILLYRKPFTWRDNIKKKIRTLLVPYIIVNSFWIIIYFICQHISSLSIYFSEGNKMVADWELTDWFQAYGLSEGYPVIYPLWFVRDLFVLNIFAIIIKRLMEKFMWPSLVVLIGIYLLVDISASQVICFWGCGCFIVCRNINLESLDKIDKKNLSILYIFIIIGDVVTRTYRWNSIIHNICIIVGIIFWFVCFTTFRKEKLKKVLLGLSSYTFSIYLFHERNLSFLQKLSARVLPVSTICQLLEYIFIPVIIISGVLLFSVMLKKIFPNVYAVITGNRIR